MSSVLPVVSTLRTCESDEIKLDGMNNTCPTLSFRLFLLFDISHDDFGIFLKHPVFSHKTSILAHSSMVIPATKLEISCAILHSRLFIVGSGVEVGDFLYQKNSDIS